MENLSSKEPTAKMIFDGVTDHAIIRTDASGTICDWNSGAENILKYKKDEIIGKNIAEIFTPEDRAKDIEKAEMRLAVKNGKSEDKRWHLKNHGVRFYGNGIMNPLRDEKNQLVGFVKVLRDETAKHQAELLLKETQEHLQLALLSAHMGLWRLNLHNNEITTSPELRIIFGLDDHERDVFKLINALIHPEDRKRVTRVLQEAIKNSSDYSDQFRIFDSKGAIKWLMSRGSTKIDSDGVPIFSGIALDITHLKEVEEALERSVQQLKNERDLRDRFVATLSHDLRTPLTAAKIGAQIVSRKVANDPDLLRTTLKISSNMDRADKMIRDLLDASYIRAGQVLALKPEKLELRSLFHEILEEMSTVYGDRFLLQGDSKVEGVWDPDAIKRILENLISNAIKYGAKNTKVTVTLKSLEDTVQFQIHNEGKPIPQEDRAILFEQFRRAKTAKSGEQIGWGLGLALVKGFVDAHKGSIEVESTAEKGTTFTIVLPKNLA